MVTLHDVTNPKYHFHTVINRELIANHNDFLSALYIDLSRVITLIEEDRATAIQDEDNITASIRRGLRQYEWTVTHDTKEGGHIDLLVEFSDYKWKAEAKLNNGAAYLTKAYEQVDVYASHKEIEVGFLIYNFNTKIDLTIERFEKAAMALPDYEIKFNDFCKTTYTNTSTFKHNSGNFMTIKYFWINLYHNQRTSKKVSD